MWNRGVNTNRVFANRNPPPHRINASEKIAKSLGNIGAVDNASHKCGGVSRVRLISAKANMKHNRPLWFWCVCVRSFFTRKSA